MVNGNNMSIGVKSLSRPNLSANNAKNSFGNSTPKMSLPQKNSIVSGNDLKFNGKKVVPGFSSSRQVNRLGGVTNSNSLSALSMIGNSNNKQGFGG